MASDRAERPLRDCDWLIWINQQANAVVTALGPTGASATGAEKQPRAAEKWASGRLIMPRLLLVVRRLCPDSGRSKRTTRTLPVADSVFDLSASQRGYQREYISPQHLIGSIDQRLHPGSASSAGPASSSVDTVCPTEL